MDPLIVGAAGGFGLAHPSTVRPFQRRRVDTSQLTPHTGSVMKPETRKLASTVLVLIG
jgi:hypothetical protein